MPLDINVFGEYSHRDLPTIPVATVDPELILRGMRAFAAAQDAILREMTALFVHESDATTESFGQNDRGRFQRMGEVSTIEARRFGGKYQIGFPIWADADRFMYTQAYLDEANLAELNTHVVNVAMADTERARIEILKSLMLKTNYDFNDDLWPGKKTGTIKVKRLLNGDGADEGYVYVPADGREIAISSLNHYVTSGSATLDNGAYTLARDKMRNLGNDARLIYLTSSTTADQTEGLSNFVGVQESRIVDPNGKFARVSGARARGLIANGEVWSFPGMPDGYIVGIDLSKPKPVRRRISHLSKYRGLMLAHDENRGEILTQPLVNKRWLRVEGYAIQDRTNGVVVQVASSGTYTDPTL